MCLGRIIAFISFFVVVIGAQRTYTGFTQRKQLEISLAEIETAKPEAKWLKITGGVMDVTLASSIGFRGVNKAIEAYIPLVPTDFDPGKDEIHVLVLSRDPEMLRLCNESSDLKSDDPAKSIEFLIRNRDLLRRQRTIEGVAQYGLERGGSRDRKILKSHDRIVSDALIIDEGKTPSVKGGVLMIGCGLGGILLSGLLGARRKSPPSLPSGPVPPAGGTPPPLPR